MCPTIEPEGMAGLCSKAKGSGEGMGGREDATVYWNHHHYCMQKHRFQKAVINNHLQKILEVFGVVEPSRGIA